MHATPPRVEGYCDLLPIGQGGFATVYRATQIAVGRPVALKIITSAVVDDETARRFQRECHAVGALSWHPHIAQILDAGVTPDNRPYLAFELLEGGSLWDRVAERPLPCAEAIAIGVHVADALAAAHDAGVLHRDVKPANILIDRLGRARLADFGIASMQDGHQTATGVVSATIAHAAPELLDGRRATVQADVYALGSTLHTLISGTPPFGGSQESLLTMIARIAQDPPPDLRICGTPDVVAAVIETALAKEPGDRHSDATDLGRSLQQCQRMLGLEATDMPWADQHRATVAAPAPPTIAIANTGEVVVADTDALPPPPRPPAPPPPPLAAVAHHEPTPAPATGAVAANARPSHRGRWAAVATFVLVAAVAGTVIALSGGQRNDDRAATAPASATERVDEDGVTGIDGDGSVDLDAEPDRDVAPGQDPAQMQESVGPISVSPMDDAGAQGAVSDAAVPSPSRIPPAAVQASGVDTPAVDGLGNAVSYEAGRAIDGDVSTAWRVAGNGVGHQLVIDFGAGYEISRIGLIPGYAKIDPDPSNPVDRFTENRRVREVRYRFSDGTTTTQTFRQRPVLQLLDLADAVDASWVVIEIVATTPPNGRDAAPISEIAVFGVPLGERSLQDQPPPPSPAYRPAAAGSLACAPSERPVTDQVYVVVDIQADDPDGGLVAHRDPGIAAPVTDVFPNDSELIAVGGCRTLDGFEWWQVDTGSGRHWVASRWLIADS